LLGLVALAGCNTAPDPAAQPAPLPAAVADRGEGYRLAQAACSQCHSIEAFGLSPNTAAPEWPVIANTPGLTRETLTTWLTDAHNYPGEMDFYLEADEVGQLVDYMLTLRREDYHPPYQ
jgi:mono/diheme cytochrome c family protein